MLECHGLLCLLYMFLGLLVCEYIQTYSHGLSLAIHVARFSGCPKICFPLGGVERSRARKSNPVRSLWIGAAPSPCCRRELLFRCPYLCKEPSMVVMYWFEPLWLMNHVTVVPMFLVRVEARTPEWFLGWCVDDTRLCTVVFRRGVTNSGIRAARLTVGYP